MYGSGPPSYGARMLGGDPADLTALAHRLTTTAESVADVAGASGDAPAWQGVAAVAHKERLAQVVADLTALRGDVDEAATAVADLAAVVQERQQFLLSAWNEAREAFENAVDGTVDGAQKVWSYAEDAGGWAQDKLEDVKFW